MAIQVKRSDYLEWDVVPEAVSYEAALVNPSTLEVLVNVPVVAPEVLVGDLAAGQDSGLYGIRVRTYDGVEFSDYSPQVSVEVLAPNYPSNIRKKV